MLKKTKPVFFIATLLMSFTSFSQTWVDTVDSYARKSYLPASHYMWNWVDASLLNAMIKQYDLCQPSEKHIYFDYVKKAMDKTYFIANGQRPNAVASGIGLAFLYKITKDVKYKNKADKIYADYLKIRRTKDGAVSHLVLFTELWDDTVFMIGQFLLGMYQATGDEKYLDELARQISLHRDKLQDKKTGHWYQLPVRNTDPKNFIESSSTAMFAYGIQSAIRLGLVSDPSYKTSADLAYRGLREYSLAPISKDGLIPKNVCVGTCIGDKNYYLHRGVQKGKPYGFAMFMEFGTRYEIDHGTRKAPGK